MNRWCVENEKIKKLTFIIIKHTGVHRSKSPLQLHLKYVVVIDIYLVSRYKSISAVLQYKAIVWSQSFFSFTAGNVKLKKTNALLH